MYYLLYGSFYALSLLPLRILYALSTLMFYLVYYVFGYRKSVTMSNLNFAFPEKTDLEKNIIAKQYYRNLCDSVVETVKLLSMSKAELNKRMTSNWEVIHELEKTGKVIQGHLSHLFNWEWGIVVANYNTSYTFTGLYNRISSQAMNKLMQRIRSRSGSALVDMDDMQSVMGHYQKQQTLWGFIADQNPSEPRRGAWVNFLNRETSFFKGAELVARRYGNAVVFGRMIRLKRGYYHIEIEKIFDNGKETVDGEITRRYVQFLEQCIRQQPDNWVWSHRRWKHTRS